MFLFKLEKMILMKWKEMSFISARLWKYIVCLVLNIFVQNKKLFLKKRKRSHFYWFVYEIDLLSEKIIKTKKLWKKFLAKRARTLPKTISAWLIATAHWHDKVMENPSSSCWCRCCYLTRCNQCPNWEIGDGNFMRFWQEPWISCFSVAEITSDLLFVLPLSIQQKGTVAGALTLGRWINNIKALISIAKFMPVLNVLGVLNGWH